MLDRRTDCSKNKLRNNFFSKLTSTKSNRDTKIIARFIGKVKDAGEKFVDTYLRVIAGADYHQPGVDRRQ